MKYKLLNCYLSISPRGKKVIFNNSKTDIKYGQQVFKLTDPELDKIIDNIYL